MDRLPSYKRAKVGQSLFYFIRFQRTDIQHFMNKSSGGIDSSSFAQWEEPLTPISSVAARLFLVVGSSFLVASRQKSEEKGEMRYRGGAREAPV